MTKIKGKGIKGTKSEKQNVLTLTTYMSPFMPILTRKWFSGMPIKLFLEIISTDHSEGTQESFSYVGKNFRELVG